LRTDRLLLGDMLDAQIDWDAVWEVTQRHTAALRPQIEGILASLPANPPSP